MGRASGGVVVEDDHAAVIARFKNDVGVARRRAVIELGAAAGVRTSPVVDRCGAGCGVIVEASDAGQSAVAAAREAAVVDNGGGGGRVVVKRRRATVIGGAADVFDQWNSPRSWCPKTG